MPRRVRALICDRVFAIGLISLSGLRACSSPLNRRAVAKAPSNASRRTGFTKNNEALMLLALKECSSSPLCEQSFHNWPSKIYSASKKKQCDQGVEEIIQQTGLDENGDHMISKVCHFLCLILSLGFIPTPYVRRKWRG